jgi:phospholipase/carboxylesterase
MDLDFLIRRANNPNKKTGCIFMFHGYGSNKEDLFSLEQYLPSSQTIISLEAPLKLPFGGFSWFDIDYSDVIENNLDKRYKEINESIDSLLKNIDRHIENENLNKDDITILGFSQGGSICWKLGLDYSKKFRRVIPLSSFIHPSYLNEKLDSYKELLIYSSHGTQDEVIPISLVEDYIKSLSIKNDLIFEKFESGHTISQRNLINLINWIEETKI